jgi:hypothetical protein
VVVPNFILSISPILNNTIIFEEHASKFISTGQSCRRLFLTIAMSPFSFAFENYLEISVGTNCTRMRRIKCDETKPACMCCAGTNRVCDFLDTSPKVTQPKPTMTSRSKKSLAIISSRQLKLLPKPFTPGKPATGHEIDHFEYFTVMCNGSLLGYFENPLWNKTILQISHSEPAIRNAAIALASILRYHYTQAHSSIDRHEPTLNYHNALQALNRRLDGSAISWELALLGSLLFTSFEALGGRDAGALQHLDAGLAVLDEYALTHPVSSSYKIVFNTDTIESLR